MTNPQSNTPTFVGIGATKSGSTWLYTNLSAHPDIHTPIKEVSYFNKHAHRGISWYESLFSTEEHYTHAGEFTPSYLYCSKAPEIVSTQFPNIKILVILRNPVYRAYSQFKSNYYTGLTKAKTFEDYIALNPTAIEQGYYSKYIKKWLEVVPRSNIKIFIFEEAVNDFERFRVELSNFLSVDPAGFSIDVFEKKANVSDAPKFKKIYQIGYNVSQFARRYRLYKVSKTINKTGSKLFGILGVGRNLAPKMHNDTYSKLFNHYANDISNLCEIMGRVDPIWSMPKISND